jgi:hypothetical protein
MRQAPRRTLDRTRTILLGIALGLMHACIAAPALAEDIAIAAQRSINAPLPTGDQAWLLLDGGQLRIDEEVIDFDRAALQIWQADAVWTVSVYCERGGESLRRLATSPRPVVVRGGDSQRMSFASLQNDALYRRGFGPEPTNVQGAGAVMPAALMQPLPMRGPDGEIIPPAADAAPPAVAPPPVRTRRQPDGVPETVPAPRPIGPAPPQPTPNARAGRRLRAFPRGTERLQLESRPTGQGDIQVTTITGGVQLLIDGVTVAGTPDGSQTADLSADRMVIWSTGVIDLMGNQPAEDRQQVEVYLEGNIVFRQGERVIFAERMYYNVPREMGIVIDAELLTPVPEQAGLFRVASPFMRQVAPGRFYAEDAFFTTSLLGRPTYRWQSGTVYVEDREFPIIDPATGAPLVNPVTGQVATRRSSSATTTNNTLRLGEVPVFYWPYLSADLRDPNIFIDQVGFKQNDIFGTQILLGFDMYDILGAEAPPGHRWRLRTDYLSERGFGHGTDYTYRGSNLLGLPSDHYGDIHFWGIQDSGLDNLGAGREALQPEEDYRYRLIGRHRQYFDNDVRFSADVGWISDRNFLEQYYEADWDNGPDLPTRLELYQAFDNQSWRITGQYNLNEFFLDTNKLPQVDHTILGQNLLNNWLTWHSHTEAGYSQIRAATPPEDPAELINYTPLPDEADVQGERFITAQEIDLPLQIGAGKVVPYVMGQFGHWGEDLTGNSLDRVYGRVGFRTSLPMWAVYSDARSDLLNIDGLAHKISFDTDQYIAEASEDVTQLPRYSPLDDNNVEAFRRRFPTLNFGMSGLPAQYDDRFFAIRSGLPESVTNPTPEYVDDLQVVRLALNQRLQTHRGPRGNQHVVDWITFNTHLSYFPEGDRDNFGEDAGLAGYHLLWNVGDRLAFYSDGDFDVYDGGRRFVTFGTFLERPEIGRIGVAYKSLEGPFSTQAIDFTLDYRLSQKWHGLYYMFVDLSPGGNIVQNFQLTRIGESFLLRFGVSFSESKDTLTYNFSLEPRLLVPGPLAGVGPDGRRRFE